MPFLSVIIPTKNEEQHLPALLQCLQGQTFKDYEIIIADAGSQDRTCQIATDYGAKVVSGGRPGPGRNRGAEAAQGELFVFFDADVSLPSQRFLEGSIEEIKKKKLEVASCRVRPLSSRPLDRALHEAYNTYMLAMEHLRPHGTGACIFSRADVHKALGGFDEQVFLAEDQEYIQRAVHQGRHYRVLRSHPIIISVRRLDKDGRLSLALKYLYTEMKLLTRSSLKDMPFEYDMGGDKKKEEIEP